MGARIGGEVFNVSTEDNISTRKAINGMKANKTHWISSATYLPWHDSDTQRATHRAAEQKRKAKTVRDGYFRGCVKNALFSALFTFAELPLNIGWCVLCVAIFKTESCREHNKWNNVISHLTIYTTTASGKCGVCLEKMKKRARKKSDEKDVEKSTHRTPTQLSNKFLFAFAQRRWQFLLFAPASHATLYALRRSHIRTAKCDNKKQKKWS